MLHIRISLDTKFQLKVTIFNFWTEINQKGYFRSEENKIKIIIEFYGLELV